jgi:hypothetical protein
MTNANRHAAACALAAAWLFSGGCSSDVAYGPAGPSAGAGGAAGMAGGGGAGGSTQASCPDSGGPVDPTAMIDEMESPDPAILMIGGRNGSWWAGGDMVSPSASIAPNGDAAAEAIPAGGRCGSRHAMHVTGQGFTSWATLTTSLVYGSADGGPAQVLPYDAHDRTGVTFWARIGDTSANQVRFSISDKYTRPEGGICDASVSTGPTACYDTAGVDLTQLGTRWTQYRIPFSGLGQRHFGLQESALDTRTIYTIEFDLFVNEIFDLWVDDIAFY